MQVYGRFIGEAGYGLFINGKLTETSQDRAYIARKVLDLQAKAGK